MKDKIEVNLQSSIRIKDKNTIYFDPFKISDERHDADMILITHDHFDHLDIDSINNLIHDETLVVVPNSIMGECIDKGIPANQLVSVIPNKKYFRLFN